MVQGTPKAVPSWPSLALPGPAHIDTKHYRADGPCVKPRKGRRVSIVLPARFVPQILVRTRRFSICNCSAVTHTLVSSSPVPQAPGRSC